MTGGVTWEYAARLCYKRVNSSRGDHETAPESRGGTCRATSEANAPQSGPQVSVPHLLFLREVFTLTVSLSPLSEAHMMNSAYSFAGLLLFITIQSSWQFPNQDRNSM